MKKLLLTLMMLLSVTATLVAQSELDLEQTDVPSYDWDLDPVAHGFECNLLYLSCYDNDAEIYYRYLGGDMEPLTEWALYEWGLRIEFNTDYIFLECYAVAPGKLPSEHVVIQLIKHVVFEPIRYYDFAVDGFFYRNLYNTDHCVAVAKEWVTSEPFSDWFIPNPYNGDPYPCYSGDVVIPATVDYNGETYQVTAIFYEAFVECELDQVVMPNTITSIGGIAFFDSSLSSIVLSDSLAAIGYFSFGNCTQLKTIELPASLTSIEDGAFFGCTGLTSVICKAVIPPVANSESWGCFGYWEEHEGEVNVYEQASLFVPEKSLEAYRADVEWGKFSRIVPFLGAGPGDINGDGSFAISDVSELISRILNGGDNVPAYCDVNGDGMVTIADVTVLISMVLHGN